MKGTAREKGLKEVVSHCVTTRAIGIMAFGDNKKMAANVGD